MQFSAQGSVVTLSGGSRRDFGRRVKKVLDLGTRLVVLLDSDDGPPVSENVVALDSSAQVIWRVQEFDFPNGRTPYTQISQAEDGTVKAYNFSGIMVVLDPQTGRITRSYVAK
jgi:hypothetical protein